MSSCRSSTVASTYPGRVVVKAISSGEGIVDVPDVLRGARVALATDAVHRVGADVDMVQVAVVVSGAVTIRVGADEWHLGPGQLLALAPGWEATVSARSPSSVALHQVSRTLLAAEWLHWSPAIA
jgi:hypothetical protein